MRSEDDDGDDEGGVATAMMMSRVVVVVGIWSRRFGALGGAWGKQWRFAKVDGDLTVVGC